MELLVYQLVTTFVPSQYGSIVLMDKVTTYTLYLLSSNYPPPPPVIYIIT